MDIKTSKINNTIIAIVHSEKTILIDEQSALDFMMTVQHQTGSNLIALNKEAIFEDFFDLSTRIAGNILQKFVNYNMKFAIIGDFSSYTSKPLKDFIYECNKGNNIFFVSSEQEAIDKLSSAR